MKRILLVIPLAAGVLAGCSSEPNVSAEEEAMYKNPAPVDRSKIPANPSMPKGPAFIGEPSKGSGGGAKPPGAGG